MLRISRYLYGCIFKPYVSIVILTARFYSSAIFILLLYNIDMNLVPLLISGSIDCFSRCCNGHLNLASHLLDFVVWTSRLANTWYFVAYIMHGPIKLGCSYTCFLFPFTIRYPKNYDGFWSQLWLCNFWPMPDPSYLLFPAQKVIFFPSTHLTPRFVSYVQIAFSSIPKWSLL